MVDQRRNGKFNLGGPVPMFTRNLLAFVTLPFLVTSARAILLSAVQPLSAQQGETLTNADVIKMEQAHLSADVIVEQIRANSGKYVLTTANLVRLKQIGVPDKVIAAMQAKQAAAPAPEAKKDSVGAQEPSQSANEAPCESAWNVATASDDLTKQEYKNAQTCVKGTPVGRFDIVAQCDGNKSLLVAVWPRGAGLALRRSVVPQSKGMTGGGSPGQSCVHMRVQPGRKNVTDYYSPECEMSNHTLLYFIGDGFWDDRSRQLQGNARSVISAWGATADPGMANLGRNMDQLAEAFRQATVMNLKATGPGLAAAGAFMPESDLVSESSLGIELPLMDGNDTVIRLDLTDPTFRNYYNSYCAAPRVPAATSIHTSMSNPPSPDAWSQNLGSVLNYPGSDSYQPGQYAKAISRLDQACKQVDFGSCNDLGTLYADGLGVKQDKTRAFNLYGHACDWGNMVGCDNIAHMFQKGEGGAQKSYRLDLYKRACEGGVMNGCNDEGVLYAIGTPGVPRDYAKAQPLFDLACGGGVQEACKNRSLLSKGDALIEQGSDPASPQSTPVNAVWTDPATGLTWAGKDSDHLGWQQATDYCRNLRLDGQGDWRLATIDELKGIYEPTSNVPARQQSVDDPRTFHVKGNLQLTGWIWASTPGNAPETAWAFYFATGARVSFPLGDNPTGGRALCVRRSGK